MSTFIDLTGQTFKDWRVVCLYKKAGRPNSTTIWTCECVCGVRKNIWRSSLTQGTTTNCGCKPNANALPGDESAFRRLYYDYKDKALEEITLST